MMGGVQLVKTLWQYRDSLVIVLTPVLLASLLVVNSGKEARCGYVVLTMAVFWVTEAVPLPVTALIPVFAYPLLGILSTDDVCFLYMKETNMMFLGGITVAVAVECCNLHTRIALKVLLVVGQSLRMLMAGFMLTTTFLSMWLSNVATAVLMLPIAEAILNELYTQRPEKMEENGHNKDDLSVLMSNQNQLEQVPANGHRLSSQPDSSNSKLDGRTSKKPGEEEEGVGESGVEGNTDDKVVRNALLTTIMYSANLGGTGVLTGTGPNLILKSMLQSTYSEPTGLTFLSWMLFNVPGMVICAFLAWIWLQVYYLGLFCCKKKKNMVEESTVKKLVEQKYRDLGPIRFQEIVVLILFVILVFLWLFRAPEFIAGWAKYFHDTYGVKVKSATPVMFIVFLFFAIPAKLNFLCFRKPGDTECGGSKDNSCLTWDTVEKKVPWGVLLVLGGGFAMAEGVKASGLSTWLGDQLFVFAWVTPSVIVLAVTLLTAFITEFASNTATSSILLPVLNVLALRIKVNPIYLMLPATVCASYAFMLPASTPPNTIIYSAAKMNTWEMIKAGIVMNVVCVIVINVMINTLGVALFDLNTFPAWANSTTIV